jgi:hypothetical protein
MQGKDAKNSRIQLLDKDAQEAFRADYRQTETEVQKNIAVYLSALVVATGWVFGPKSKPIEQLFLGNEAANLFGFIILIAINAIFASFLTYKSIQIHEIMQFVITLSPKDSALVYWEAWRRSRRRSLSKAGKWGLTRGLYFFAISLVPFWVSFVLIASTSQYTWQNPKDVATKIQEMQKATISSKEDLPGNLQDSAANKSDSKPSKSAEPKPVTKSDGPPQELITRVERRLSRGKACLIIIGLFHAIPLWLFYVSWLNANGKWKEISQLKGLPDFDLEITSEEGPPNFITT